jgi:hypothetical protein
LAFGPMPPNRPIMVTELSLHPDNDQRDSEQHIDYFTQVLYVTGAARYILYALDVDHRLVDASL